MICSIKGWNVVILRIRLSDYKFPKNSPTSLIYRKGIGQVAVLQEDFFRFLEEGYPWVAESVIYEKQ